jgi:hypothetical protein
MSNPARMPPPEVQRAASVVRNYLDAEDAAKASPAPHRDLQAHFAERLNYCRQFDQTKMPAWKDPRTPR